MGRCQPVCAIAVACRIIRFPISGYENPQREKMLFETQKKGRAGLCRRPVPAAAGGCCGTLGTGDQAACLGKLVPNCKGAQGCCSAVAEPCSGHCGSPGLSGRLRPHLWVMGSQIFPHPRGRRSRIGPRVGTSLCYRVIYGIRQRRSRNAESSRTPF